MTSPPPAMPEYRAIQPALCPITSITITLLCELAVECKRSMASVAMLTAESNPKEISVPQISLSMVLGTDTMLTPIAANLAAVFCVPFPPMQTTQSSPISWIFWRISAGLSTSETTPPFLKGFSREVPNIVPPWFNNPDKDLSVKDSMSFVSKPWKPLWIPITSIP